MEFAVDFAMLPPEINSGRMYLGAGSEPLIAASTAWDGLAAELSSAATSYRGVIAELTDDMWLGPSSMLMSAAATPYAAWMNAVAAEAEQTANQIRSAVAAYEAALVAMVPPPLIEANRALLAHLVATNIVGQNTAAIANTEAQYSEMWAQDAGAMFRYAGASAAATKVTPFTPAPQNTNPASTASQAAATAHAAASTTANSAQTVLASVPNTLHGLASGASFNPLQILANIVSTGPIAKFDGLSLSTGAYALIYASSTYLSGGIEAQVFPLMSLALPKAAVAANSVTPDLGAGLGTLAGSSAPTSSALGSAGLGAAGVSAGLGEATSVGKLSVPPSWGTASPEIRLASTALPLAGLDAAPAAGAAAPGGFFGGLPPMASVVNAPRGNDTYSRELRTKMLGHEDGKPGASEHTPSRPAQPQHRARSNESTLNAYEAAEVDQLRREIAEAAMERDAVARLIREAIR